MSWLSQIRGLDHYSNRFISHQAILFKHVAESYEYVSIEQLPPTEEDYRLLANQFFTDPNDIDDAVQRIMSDDPWAGLEYGSAAFTKIDNFDRFVRINLPTKLPPLNLGTYTLVFKLGELFPTWHQTLLKKFAQFFVPVAYAASPGTYKITFTLKNPTPELTGASSVLFLPGIQASLLYKVGLAGTEDQIWTPDGNQDVRQLAMNSVGVSQNQVYTKGIMTDIPLGGTVYDSFARSMVNLVQDKLIKGWTPFAYDWRYGVDDVANNGTKYQNETRKAIDEIQYLASSSFTGKVTIIGHSNGGLLAKAIIKKLSDEGKANLVDKVVFLASPQLGTPKAIGTILHGYDQEKLGGWIIDDVDSRDVIQNMPGAYGLIPTQRYINSTADKIIKFENSSSTQQLRSTYGDNIDSEDELKRFMIGTSDGRLQATTIDEILRSNELLLTQQLGLHNTLLDNWVAPSSTKVIEIIGTGLDTVSGFEYRGFTERICTLGVFSCQIKEFYKPIPLISTKGDKTVISLSAEGYTGTKEQYFIDLKKIEDIKINEAVEHYNISENPSIQKLIKNILLATSTDIEFISKGTTNTNNNRVLLGVHSPAEIEVIATNGKRVGKKVVSGGITKEEGIVGSSYFEIGTSKYIIVPADTKYNIHLLGTAEGGLTFSVDKLSGAAQVPEIAVQVATITASTSIKINYESNNVLSNLEIDTNGDSVTDILLTPQGVDITPKITYKTLRDKINSLSLSAIRKLPLLALVTAADILDKKSVTNPQLISAERFTLNQLEALLSTYQKKGWISQSTLDDLKFVINKLK